MASKENAERKELHRKIWAIADDVRGAVDVGISSNTYWESFSIASFPNIWLIILITLSTKLVT